MHCPTCASPLPVGAMFCGVCGRAVTAADVAAAAARRDDEGSVAEAGSEPPAWQLRQPPRPTTTGDAPWWVRERRVDAGTPEPRSDERTPSGAPHDDQPDEEAPPAWVAPVTTAPPGGGAATVEPPAAPAASTASAAPIEDREAEARERSSRAATAAATASSAPVGEPSSATVTGASVPGSAPVPPRPAPLRQPGAHADNGPRPTSAPLWTASLAPLPTEQDDPAAASAASSASEATPTLDEPAGDETATPAGESSDAARPAASPDPAHGAAAPSPDRAADSADVESQTGAGGGPVAPPEHALDERRDDEAPAGSQVGASEAPSASPVAHRADHGHDADDDGGSARGAHAHGDSADSEAPGRDAEPSAVDGPATPVPLRAPGRANEPVAGDTAPVTPVSRAERGEGLTPAPAPLVEPGQQKAVEHCTHCGAQLHEDDIFCPECGAVVQSVALSFTGPVAPLPPEWRPAAQAPPAPTAAPAAPAPAAAPAPTPATTPAPDPAPAERAPAHASASAPDEADAWRPRSVAGAQAAPSDDGKDDGSPRNDAAGRADRSPLGREAVPGRSGDPSGSPASAASPPVLPPMPAAPAASALSGLLAQDARARLATDDDVDETRLVRRGPAGTEYLLQFSTGESVTVDGSGLVGRAPSPQPGERFDHLVRIVDPGKSVSKTHLEFGQELGALWVSDRWSGNGTVVRPPEQPARRVEPGTRVRVARGTRVEIGEQFFVVS